MRISELRNRLADYFPDPDTYARDIVHSELGGTTVNGAIGAAKQKAQEEIAKVTGGMNIPGLF